MCSYKNVCNSKGQHKGLHVSPRWTDAISFCLFSLDAFFGTEEVKVSHLWIIVWLSGFANRGTWGILFCWPSAPPSSWINPTDTPWQRGAGQQVQRDVQLCWSLHVGRQGGLHGEGPAPQMPCETLPLQKMSNGLIILSRSTVCIPLSDFWDIAVQNINTSCSTMKLA